MPSSEPGQIIAIPDLGAPSVRNSGACAAEFCKWLSFQTFPFPRQVSERGSLDKIGASYNTHRAGVMIAYNEGLTRTYNRFHNPTERAPDIQRLRELHHAMDVAVLRAYGWDDL